MENTLEDLAVAYRYRVMMARMERLGDQIDRKWYDLAKTELYYLREEFDRLEDAIDKQL